MRNSRAVVQSLSNGILHIALRGIPKAFCSTIKTLAAYLLGAVALDRDAVERPEDMKLNREPSIVCN